MNSLEGIKCVADSFYGVLCNHMDDGKEFKWFFFFLLPVINVVTLICKLDLYSSGIYNLFCEF